MYKTLAFTLIALFFGTGFGFLLAVSTGATLDGHDHGSHGHEEETHTQEHGHNSGQAHHGHDAFIELNADVAPELEFQLHPDAGGWNLQLVTRNFRFSPENVNGPHVDGEGHAHVYVDGVKIARIYSPWFHLGDIAEGAEVLTVTLNSNNHSGLSVGGNPISVSCMLADCVKPVEELSD